LLALTPTAVVAPAAVSLCVLLCPPQEEEAAMNAAADAAALNNGTAAANGTAPTSASPTPGAAAPSGGAAALVRSISRAGQAEPTGHGPLDLPPADANTAQRKAVDNRRFMIYVHSKLMIVDDEYIVVGR
jgi:phosphatidylserine/phosphatidylglycerophosphate/cardiolipin synthase-like enzyme